MELFFIFSTGGMKNNKFNDEMMIKQNGIVPVTINYLFGIPFHLNVKDSGF